MNNAANSKRRFQKDSSSSNSQEFGRVPPHSVEAEESVLGAILLDNEALNTALERLQEDDFYRGAHKAIYKAMAMLSEKREPVDVITLSQALRSMGQLDEAGGLEKLTSLTSMVPSAANIAYYAKVVRELSMRRRLIHEATEIVNEAFDLEGEVEEFLDKSEQRVLGVSEYRAKKSFYRVADVVQESIQIVEARFDQKCAVTGVPTGFKQLDHLTAGFQPSDLIIIAARPSMGKTALALSIAQFVGINGVPKKGNPKEIEKLGVAVFSLEMSKEQIVLRMLSGEARVSSSRVRTGHLGDRDFPKLVDAAGRIAEASIYIDDTAALTITEVRAKARRLNREHRLALIVVDYLQLMRSPAYSHSREQEISDISRSLKALAKELKVPVIALSQLNRSVESRPNKRPMMSDLRESGAIEQDADVIMFIYRDEQYDPDSPEKGIAEIIISKQRSGPTGMAKLAFSGEYTRFDNLADETTTLESYSEAQGDGSGFSLEFGGAAEDDVL